MRVEDLFRDFPPHRPLSGLQLRRMRIRMARIYAQWGQQNEAHFEAQARSMMGPMALLEDWSHDQYEHLNSVLETKFRPALLRETFPSLTPRDVSLLASLDSKLSVYMWIYGYRKRDDAYVHPRLPPIARSTFSVDAIPVPLRNFLYLNAVLVPTRVSSTKGLETKRNRNVLRRLYC